MRRERVHTEQHNVLFVHFDLDATNPVHTPAQAVLPRLDWNPSVGTASTFPRRPGKSPIG